jgi:uncharacterized protein YjbI with pentapeptide repeats
LTDHNFHAEPAGSLVGANFTGATLKGAIFAGQDLTGASFQGAALGPSTKGPVDFTNTTLNQTCFINATMDATDFSYAVMTCADFSNTSLMQAQFGPQQNIQAGSGCRTTFNGSAIDVNAITTDNWGKTDFTSTKFQNLSPATFSLSGKDITGAVLAYTNFSNIDMTGANLTGVDFTGATLLNATLDNTAMNGVTLIKAHLQYATLTCAQFYGSTPTSACKTPPPVSTNPNKAADLTQAVLMHADLSNATLDSATLTGANLSGATLRNASFKGATLEPSGNILAATVLGGDFTGANFETAHLNSVSFNNAILTGARFDQNTTLNGTDFSGSIMPGANFTNAVLEGVKFHATILQNGIFTGATMKTTPSGGSSGVVFTCAQLGGANFSNATITAADFTAAVMPPGSGSSPPQPCCPQPAGDPWCGTIDITQQAYGPVTYPVLTASVNCPSGDVASCAGNQWVINGENLKFVWQTDLCSTPPSMQTLWSPPDCSSPPGDVVNFKDPNLKQCILDALPGKPSDITLQTAAQMLAIDCPGKGITDLTGLEKFTSLTSLDLTANQLTQFNLPLTQLQSLKIADNLLTTLDLSSLPTTSPIRLDASNNQLQSIVNAGNLTFVVLDISHNQLTTFDLPVQTALAYADLSYNNLTNVLNPYQKDLSALTQLSYLDLSHNSIPTIGSAASIAEPPPPPSTQQPPLQTLFLACNPTFACASLGLDGQSAALQTSKCADYQTQTGQWILLTNPPPCPLGQQRLRRSAVGRP